MFSTSGDVQYIGGFSTLGGYHEYIRQYHEYIRGVQYIGVCHDAYGDIMMHVASKLVKTF